MTTLICFTCPFHNSVYCLPIFISTFSLVAKVVD